MISAAAAAAQRVIPGPSCLPAKTGQGRPPILGVMRRTEAESRRSAVPAAAGRRTTGTVAAYAAAAVAFAYALVSLYWGLGGHRLVSTVGGYVAQFARDGGAVPVLVALAATAA